MIKADFHTHSTDSYDGGLNRDDYANALESGTLDVIAITDHRATSLATKLSKSRRFRHSIIPGQEVRSRQGEIIGLYIHTQIEDGLNAQETVQAIRKQRGFVLIPHPQDPHRDGMLIEDMEAIVDGIDAIEGINGRQIGRPSNEVRHWARSHNIPTVACSDAHALSGIGRTYTQLPSMPHSAESLREILSGNIKILHERPPLRSYLAPKLNRIKNKLR